MNHCLDCGMKRKLYYCCHSHPETGESIELKLSNGRIVNACPELDRYGNCLSYSSRPAVCEEYLCPRLQKLDLNTLLGYD